MRGQKLNLSKTLSRRTMLTVKKLMKCVFKHRQRLEVGEGPNAGSSSKDWDSLNASKSINYHNAIHQGQDLTSILSKDLQHFECVHDADWRQGHMFAEARHLSKAAGC